MDPTWVIITIRPVIPVIIMIPGIGIHTGICLLSILDLAGAGEACIGDIHIILIIIPITVTGTDIMMVTIMAIGMVIMAMIIITMAISITDIGPTEADQEIQVQITPVIILQQILWRPNRKFLTAPILSFLRISNLEEILIIQMALAQDQLKIQM
jgi:hypothetical protein